MISGYNYWYMLVELECFTFMMMLVAFFILGERKFLGYMQLRKGPNKVGLVGLLQSFADFYKLLLKTKVEGFTLRSWFGGVGCFLILSSAIMLSELYSTVFLGVEYKKWLLFFLVVSSMLSYSVLLLGWGSGSKYSLMGGVRSSFASVSFEGMFMCLVLMLGELYGSYMYQSGGLIMLLVPLLYYVWWMSMLGESNRAPADFGESESELVSGYKTDYGGLPFMMIFACEYLSIYVFSWMTASMFFICTPLVVLAHLVMFMWVRGTFPRIRYSDYMLALWRGGLLLAMFSVLMMFNL